MGPMAKGGEGVQTGSKVLLPDSRAWIGLILPRHSPKLLSPTRSPHLPRSPSWRAAARRCSCYPAST